MPRAPVVEAPSGELRRRSVGTSIRLQRITIENFKGIDSLELNLPSPRMANDPDVFVMGSKNGLGKTSILESCSLLFWGIASGSHDLHFRSAYGPSFSLADLIVRAGQRETRIEGSFAVASDTLKLSLRISRAGEVTVSGDHTRMREAVMPKWRRGRVDRPDVAEEFLSSIAGLGPEPLLLAPFLYFHSYRKVQEGSPELGMMVDIERHFRRRAYRPDVEPPISRLKVEILRSLMSRGGLFENLDEAGAEVTLRTLNGLMERYARGSIQKLRPSPDNTVEFRIEPLDGGPSFSFDGLSSGQKEIISTLFLIWKYTLNQQGIVLIDEPELHLNPEWHTSFVRELNELAPQNQYVLATHSEDVFASVEPDRRLLLVAGAQR